MTNPNRALATRSVLSPTTFLLTAVLSVFVLFSTWAWNFVDLDLTVFITESDSLVGLIDRLTPPTFLGIEKVLELTLESLYMAVVGTVIGLVIALPLAFMASNLNDSKILRSASRLVISFFRSIPELVVALVAVVLFGVGQVAGVIALAFTSIGMIGRLSGTALDQLPKEPSLALSAIGASKLQIALAARLPALWPQVLSIALYRLDINLRASTMLGVVGAGGVGLLLRSTVGNLDYQAAMGVIIVIAGFVLLTELLSNLLRRRVLFPPTDYEIKAPNFPQVRPPVTRNRVITRTLIFGFIILLWQSVFYLANAVGDADWNLENFSAVASGLVFPDFVSNSEDIFLGVGETLAIATVATLLGGILGIVVGVMSVRDVTGSWIGYLIARGFLVFKRAFPTVVLALLLVVAFGLGPNAGIIALSIGTGGILAKLIGDSLEELDRRPIEALVAIGASKSQQFVSGWLPQFLPTLVGHLIYSFDINIRYSTVLGIIGAGGIGFILLGALRAYDYHTASAVIYLVFVAIVLLETLSNWLRRRIT